MNVIEVEEIGALVRTHRENANLSADALGRLIGVHGNTVLRYERGEVRLSVAQLERIAAALGLRLVVRFEH